MSLNLALRLGAIAPAGSSAVVSDSFNRADSTTLGNADTGQAWTENTSTGSKIVSNKLGWDITATDNVCTLDAGVSDGTIEFAFTTSSTSQRLATNFLFRYQDASNWLSIAMLWFSGNDLLRLTRLQTGAETTLATMTGGWATSTTYAMKLVLSGSSISLYRDNTLMLSTTSTFQQSLTRFGFRCYTGGGSPFDNGLNTIDNFTITT